MLKSISHQAFLLLSLSAASNLKTERALALHLEPTLSTPLSREQTSIAFQYREFTPLYRCIVEQPIGTTLYCAVDHYDFISWSIRSGCQRREADAKDRADHGWGVHAMDGDAPRIESIKKWSEWRRRSETERRGIQKWTEAEMRKKVLGAGLDREDLGWRLDEAYGVASDHVWLKSST